MANPNPKTAQLTLGRGKRRKLNNQTVGMRMSKATRQRLEQIAQSYDCLYGGKPQIAGLLEKIASGALWIVPAPPSLPKLISPNEMLKEHFEEKHYKEPEHGEDTSSETEKKNSSDRCLSNDAH